MYFFQAVLNEDLKILKIEKLWSQVSGLESENTQVKYSKYNILNVYLSSYTVIRPHGHSRQITAIIGILCMLMNIVTMFYANKVFALYCIELKVAFDLDFTERNFTKNSLNIKV